MTSQIQVSQATMSQSHNAMNHQASQQQQQFQQQQQQQQQQVHITRFIFYQGMIVQFCVFSNQNDKMVKIT